MCLRYPGLVGLVLLSPMILKIAFQEPIEINASEDGYCDIVQTSKEGKLSTVSIAPQLVDELCFLLEEAKKQAIANRRKFTSRKGDQ